MMEESVELDRRVGVGLFEEDGRQEINVTPASCPTRRASKVTEYTELS